MTGWTMYDPHCSWRIVHKLTISQGTLKLFVKWKGYDAIKDHTWEDEEGLV
jgi:chromobox protein 1